MSTQSIRWGRVIIGGIIAEVAVILILIALVATFGPSESASAQAFAERLGRWVGPIGGALCSFLAAFYVARPLTSGIGRMASQWGGASCTRCRLARGEPGAFSVAVRRFQFRKDFGRLRWRGRIISAW